MSDPHLLYPALIIVLQPDMSFVPYPDPHHVVVSGSVPIVVIAPVPDPWPHYFALSKSASELTVFFEIFCVFSLQSWRFCNITWYVLSGRHD